MTSPPGGNDSAQSRQPESRQPTGEVVLVRHGAVDYGALATFDPVYTGGRHDFAPLSDKGIRQIGQLIPVLRKLRPDLVVASPYTRTLQTAAILAARLTCRLEIRLELHDWLPVRDGRRPVDPGLVAEKIAEYQAWRNGGVLPPDRTWETDEEMRQRIRSVLATLDGVHTTVIVTHEAVIKAATGADEVSLASWRRLARHTSPQPDPARPLLPDERRGE